MIQTSLHQAFHKLYDPRIERCKKHSLLDVIILSILGVLSGAESYDSIELFGKENFAFLKQFLELKNGIPSHDTINRVFQVLNPHPHRFERCFIAWAQGLKEDGIMERMTLCFATAQTPCSWMYPNLNRWQAGINFRM